MSMNQTMNENQKTFQRKVSFLVLFLLTIGFPIFSRAGTISLVQEFEYPSAENVLVKIKNLGTDAAYNVKLHLLDETQNLNAVKLEIASLEALESGESKQWVLPTKELKPKALGFLDFVSGQNLMGYSGQVQIPFLVKYEDVNGNSYSNVLLIPLMDHSLKDLRPPQIVDTPSEKDLSKKGEEWSRLQVVVNAEAVKKQEIKLKFRIQNNSDFKRKVFLQIFGPDELRLQFKNQMFEIDPQKESLEEVLLDVPSGLSQSVYQIGVVLHSFQDLNSFQRVQINSEYININPVTEPVWSPYRFYFTVLGATFVLGLLVIKNWEQKSVWENDLSEIELIHTDCKNSSLSSSL